MEFKTCGFPPPTSIKGVVFSRSSKQRWARTGGIGHEEAFQFVAVSLNWKELVCSGRTKSPSGSRNQSPEGVG
jgi:hypothetical protein